MDAMYLRLQQFGRHSTNAFPITSRTRTTGGSSQDRRWPFCFLKLTTLSTGITKLFCFIIIMSFPLDGLLTMMESQSGRTLSVWTDRRWNGASNGMPRPASQTSATRLNARGILPEPPQIPSTLSLLRISCISFLCSVPGFGLAWFHKLAAFVFDKEKGNYLASGGFPTTTMVLAFEQSLSHISRFWMPQCFSPKLQLRPCCTWRKPLGVSESLNSETRVVTMLPSTPLGRSLACASSGPSYSDSGRLSPTRYR